MSTAQTKNPNGVKRAYTKRAASSLFYQDKYSSCCVKSCPHYNKPSSLLLYPMPANDDMKESWCKAFNIPKNLANNPQARVCSLHFRSRSESQSSPKPQPPVPQSLPKPSVPQPAPKPSIPPPAPRPSVPLSSSKPSVALSLPNPPVPLSLPKTTISTSQPKLSVPTNQIITVIINNNKYKVVESSRPLPSLNPPVPPDLSKELSTRPTNIEKVKFLKEAVSKIENVETEFLNELNSENTNSKNDEDDPASEQMVLEPDISEIITLNPDGSVKPVSEEGEDAVHLEPEVILDSYDDCIEDKNDDPFLELECEDEPLSETQLDCYMKEMVELLSANQTVYRLAQTSNTPRFPAVKSSETDVNTNIAVDNKTSTSTDGSSTHPISSILAPPKMFPNSIVFSPYTNTETTNSQSFLPILPPNSSVTDITKKYSVVQDASGKVLTQNISSNLSVNGNVIFTKDININQNSNFPLGSGTFIPVSSNPVLNSSHSFVPNINMANFDWKTNSNQVSVFKNNQAQALSNVIPPKVHILTPVSSVSQLKPMDSQPLNVISSQGNLPFIFSPFVSSGKSLPSNVVFTFAPISNNSELKTVFSSAPMPSISNSMNNTNGPFKTVSSQPEFSVPQPTIYQIVNLPEASKPLTLTNNLEQVGPVSFKPTDSTYLKSKQEGTNIPSPDESLLQPKSDSLFESAGPSIQIVDVKGAKEGGAGEFFGESFNLYSEKNPPPKSKRTQPLSDSNGEKSEDVDSPSDDEPEPCTIPFSMLYKALKNCASDSEANSVISIQDKVLAIDFGIENSTKSLFSIPRGDARNRLSDANGLREKLKSAGYVTEAIPWMLKKKYLPSVPPCEKCGDSILMLETIDSVKFKEGYCYTCYNTNCRNKIPVKRCAFFNTFQQFSTKCLLLLTYHWACMSPLQEIELDLEVNIEDIWSYFRALQQLCWMDVQKKVKLGSAFGNYVEASVAKVGKNFILGAYDRRTKLIRMDVMTAEEACNSTTTFKLLMDWLNPNTLLVCDKEIPPDALPGIKTLVADPSVRDIKSSFPHTLNINSYLKNNLTAMFGHCMPYAQAKEIIGKFLAERQWRDRYIRFGVEGAFWSIMDLIREQNPLTDAASATIGIPNQKKDPIIPPIEENNACQERWGSQFTEKCTTYFNSCSSNSLPSWKKETGQSKIQTYGKKRRPLTLKKRGPVLQSAKEDVVSAVSSSVDSNCSLEDYELISLDKPPLLSLLRDIPEIKGSNYTLTLDALLSVKFQHLKRPKDIINYRRSAIELGTALRKEGFHSHPVKWLVKKNFISHESRCYVCDSTAYLRDNSKFPDGCSWSCQNKECKFDNIFKRPKFFARFPHQSMNHLLALVFHWIAQTKIDNILTDTSIERQKIVHTWKAFQVKCSQTLLRENNKLGGPSCLAELAVFEHGSKYILGVYDRKSQFSAMKAYQKDRLTEEELFSFVKTWLRPGTTIIANAHPNFPLPRHYPLKVASPDPSSELNVKNITRYMSSQLKNVFGKFNPWAVSPQLTQMFLDELMWRERYDLYPITSFTKLMQELFIDKVKTSADLELNIDDEEPEMESYPVKLKEVKIVLKRIPQTVLKYYNCLDLDSSSEVNTPSKNRATTSEPGTVTKIGDGMEKDEELESIVDIENTDESSTSSHEADFPNLETTSFSDVPLTHTVFSEEVIATPSDPVFNQPKQIYRNDNSDEDYVADDSDSEVEEEEEEEVNTSEDELNPVRMYRKWKNVRTKYPDPENFKKLNTYLKKIKSANLSDSVDNFMFSDSSRNSNSAQSVQPLVINVCRKNKEPKFFIKSDSSATASATENSVDCAEVYPSDSHTGSEVSVTEASASLDSRPSVNMEQCLDIEPCVNIEPSLDIEPVVEAKISTETKTQTSEKEKKPNSKAKRRLEENVECIECGDSLGFTLDHFMKKYECADCKNYVYTTCCSNSFFEHRGSLLFGKRMPKKLKRNFGLHKNVVLDQLWYCKCGFTSSFGNKLASHLMKCPDSSSCVSTTKSIYSQKL